MPAILATATSNTLTLLLRCGLGLLAALCLAGTSATYAQQGEYRLQARPSICVSYDSEVPCRMSMQVSWEASIAGDVCLLQAEQADALACWDNARSGTAEVQYADTNDVQYRLIDAKSRSVLAETDIVVINRDLRASRKRRRHVWSIL